MNGQVKLKNHDQKGSLSYQLLKHRTSHNNKNSGALVKSPYKQAYKIEQRAQTLAYMYMWKLKDYEKNITSQYLAAYNGKTDSGYIERNKTG